VAGAQAAAAAPSLLSVAGGERPGVDPAPSSGAPATSAALQEPSLHGPGVRETLPAAAPPASTRKRREEEGGKRKAPRGRESGRTEGEADARMREEKKDAEPGGPRSQLR
jgi:hypothetical protein